MALHRVFQGRSSPSARSQDPSQGLPGPQLAQRNDEAVQRMRERHLGRQARAAGHSGAGWLSAPLGLAPVTPLFLDLVAPGSQPE